MQRSSRKAWLALCLWLVGCSFATDFDRGKIPDEEIDGGGSDASMLPDVIVDSSPGMDARPDTGMDATMDALVEAGEDAAPDTGPVGDGGAECTGNEQCPANQLCCNGLCVNTSVGMQCTACGVGCSAVNSNTCNNRTCGCDNGAACGAGTPYCVANDAGLSSCVECDQGADCASRSDGKTLCVGGRCAACDPTNNSGCMGTTPICDGTSLTCVKCTMGSNDNCPGSTVCTSTGACGGCAVAADCATPTAPICDTAATPITTCVACSGDNVCAAQIPARPLCASDGRCGVCKPVDGAPDPGCDIASATPSCRTNGGAQYTCMRCNANAQCAGGGVRNICNTATSGTTAGYCVQCTTTAPCANDSATPFCGAGNGLCQSCTAAGNAVARNVFCTAATLGARPLCDATSGRCVECTATEGCGTAPNTVCDVDAANPSNNNCVQCTARAHCSADPTKPYCDATDHTCKGCGAPGGNLGCVGDTAHPICEPTSGRCAECVGAMGCSGVNGSCLAGANPSLNDCVDCTGAVPGECTAPKSICDTVNRVCVGCLEDATCPPAAPVCNTASHQCTTCTPVTHTQNCATKLMVPTAVCTNAGVCALCDAADHDGCSASELCCGSGASLGCVATSTAQCAACGSACGTNLVCQTGARMCVACNGPTSADCADTLGTPICVGTACVACTKDSQCVAVTAGALPICNASGACTAAVACTTDPECAAADANHSVCNIATTPGVCTCPAAGMGACAP